MVYDLNDGVLRRASTAPRGIFLGLPFPGFEPGTFIPKSHFLLTGVSTATPPHHFQRISLK